MRKNRNALTTDGVMRLLRVAREAGAREHAMILLAYQHGMRASEVCDLKLVDVDLRGESVTVRRKKGSRTTVQTLARYAGEPLLDEVRTVKAWLRERGSNPSPFLFTSQKGPRLDRRTFWRIIKGLGNQAGIPDLHPHTLKHSLATHLVAADTNLAKVQQALGHASISSTMEYTHVTDSQADRARAEAMAKLYS